MDGIELGYALRYQHIRRSRNHALKAFYIEPLIISQTYTLEAFERSIGRVNIKPKELRFISKRVRITIYSPLKTTTSKPICRSDLSHQEDFPTTPRKFRTSKPLEIPWFSRIRSISSTSMPSKR
jgi:hypothetical protein